MEIEETLKKEITRLNKVNEKLENLVCNVGNTQANLGVCEQIVKNALAMSEIAKALK